MIKISHLSKSFGDRKVLEDISLEVPQGECLFVLGKSGVGKSVLLKLMVGLMEPDKGAIKVADHSVDITDPAGLAAIRKKCGLVFQFPALLDSVTVFENIAFGLRAREVLYNIADVKTRVSEQMLRVGLEPSIGEKYPTQLSFVAQKKVSIARTLAVSPDCLLFDEPTTGMDPVATSTLNRLIRKLNRDLKMTTIVVSHDIKSALSYADRIILLDQGKIVFDGSSVAFKASSLCLAREFLKGGAFGN